jgi:hypothetical protein
VPDRITQLAGSVTVPKEKVSIFSTQRPNGAASDGKSSWEIFYAFDLHLAIAVLRVSVPPWWMFLFGCGSAAGANLRRL